MPDAVYRPESERRTLSSRDIAENHFRERDISLWPGCPADRPRLRRRAGIRSDRISGIFPCRIDASLDDIRNTEFPLLPFKDYLPGKEPSGNPKPSSFRTAKSKDSVNHEEKRPVRYRRARRLGRQEKILIAPRNGSRFLGSRAMNPLIDISFENWKIQCLNIFWLGKWKI